MTELTFCVNCIHCRKESTISKTFKEYYCLKHSKTRINYVTGEVELLPDKRIKCEAINTNGNCPDWNLDEITAIEMAKLEKKMRNNNE